MKNEGKVKTDLCKNNGVKINSDFNISGWGYRHQQCLFLFLCLTAAYTLRVIMGVAFVAMIADPIDLVDLAVNKTDVFNKSGILIGNSSEGDVGNSSDVILEIGNNSSVPKATFNPDGFLNALLLKPPYPQFTWDKQTQDTIMSSFYWGYMVLQIPAGQLAHKFGAKRLLTGALMINGISSFCFPWIAYYGGWISTLFCRILQGLSQACVMPGFNTFFGMWAPLEERSRLVGFAAGGQALGTVLGLTITGFIAASPLGWPGIFRFFGIQCCIIGVIVHVMVADTPAQHPKISMAERRYIEEGIGQKTGIAKKHLSVPWARILRTRALYAILFAHIGQTWGQLTLFTEVPSFMDKVMDVNIKANGLLTALPFFVMWFTNFFFSWFTDMLVVKKIVSVTNARKIANSIGCIPPSIGLIALAFVPKNMYVVESLLVIICAFKVSTNTGYMVNPIDLSPNFAGTVISISNFASNLVGSQSPMIAGLLLTDVTSEYEWRKVFFVAAGFYFFTNLFYVILGSAERADWDKVEDPPKDLENGHETVPMLNKDKNDLPT